MIIFKFIDSICGCTRPHITFFVLNQCPDPNPSQLSIHPGADSIQPANTFFCAEPQFTVLIFTNCPYSVIGQTVLCGKCFEFRIFQPNYSIGRGSKPNVLLTILVNEINRNAFQFLYL